MGYTVQRWLEDITGLWIGYRVCNQAGDTVATFKGGANPSFYGAWKAADAECKRLNSIN